MGTKFGWLKCRSVRRRPLGDQWSRRETLDARGTKWYFDVEIDTGVPAPLEVRRREEIPTIPAPVPPPQPETQESVLRGQGVHPKARRIRAYWSEIGRTPGYPTCEIPCLGGESTHGDTGGGETWNCCGPRHTTAEPEFKFGGFRLKKTETCHRDCRLDVGTQWRRKRFQESTNLRDAARNLAQTRSCAYIYYGDAASFHEWKFHTRLRIAGKHCDQYIEAMSKVVDGPRGVMHTSRHKKLASIVYAKLSMEHLVVSTR